MLNKRQEAVAGFFQSACEFKALSKDWPDESLHKFAEVIINSTALFGETEFYAREAERCKILGIQKEREKFCDKLVKSRNLDGLQVLSDAPIVLKTVKKQVNNLQVNITRETGKLLKIFSDRFAEILVDTHLKPSDVGKVQKIVEEVTLIGTKKGMPGLLSFLEEKTNEYQKARKQEDRGVVDNAPYWKLVAVALFLGIAVIAVIHCIMFRGCNAVSASSYAGALIVLGLIALFC
jgi:hypothetical protein